MHYRILLLILCGQPVVRGSTKKGVAHWADNFLCNDFNVLNNMSWWYDWRCSLNYYHSNNICSSVIDNYKSNYVPMIWGFYQSTDYSCHAGSETNVILGANEPNHQAQSDLSPLEAKASWPIMESHSGDKILVSPSAAPCGSGCNYGNTTAWLDEFFALCQNCRVDKIATHTYWCGVDKTMDFLEGLYNRYNKSIWLTEFACRHKNNDPVKVLNFMMNILPRLEAAPYIERYAWYMARIPDDTEWVKTSASLFQANTSTLTTLGLYYNNYTHTS